VAIYKLLQNSAFGPDQIKIMTDAYEITLKALRLVDRTDPVTHIIAKKIIEIAQTNERDPARISTLTIKELGIPTGH
jgi:hypothetical protein